MSARVIQAGSSADRTLKIVGWTILALAIVAVPVLVAVPLKPSILGNSYTIGISNLNEAVAMAVAVLGLNILIGYTGQISLGNSFFVGSGAYITAVLVQDYHWSYLSTIIVVLPACMLIGIIVGLPALRIQGLYLALVTFGLANVFPSLVKLDSLADKTGASNGKSIESDLVPPDWLPINGIVDGLRSLPVIGDWVGTDELNGRQEEGVYKFFILVAIATVCFLLVRNLMASRVGRAFVALRDNSIGAEVSGVNTAQYKTLAFGLSAILSGIAGTMLALDSQLVSPERFAIGMSIFLIVGLIVGGTGSLAGSIIGGFVIVFVPHWAKQTTQVPGAGWALVGPYGDAVLGIGLIALTFLMPGGLIYGVRKLRSRIYRIAKPAIGDETDSTIGDELGPDSEIGLATSEVD